MSYEYWTCGCTAGACPAEGGYNGAYRDGVCGYVAPAPAGGGGPAPAPAPVDGCAACGGGAGDCFTIKGETGCL